MSALALLLAKAGHRISGSDLKISPQTEGLREVGVRLFLGEHRAQNVEHPDLVVVTSAVGRDNPEVAEARRRGLPVIGRGDLIAVLMDRCRGVAVAGSHGKTTTTAMIALLLLDAGLDPTCLVGGVVTRLGSNARLGQGEYMVVEADESDRSFLKLRPEIAVITNIDLEHMTAYQSENDLVAAFREFAGRVSNPSRCVLCTDDPRVRRILPDIGGWPLTYGFRQPALLTAEEIKPGFQSCVFRVRREGELWGDVRLGVGGVHNILNALAVIGISMLLGIPSETTLRSLSEYRGVARRMEKKGSAAGVVFYDDYAHHPTEIRATLAAARQSGRRLVVIFQPHRYTRTRDLFDSFADCFGDADVVYVLDVYPAGEPPLHGITSERLAEAVSRAGHPAVHFVSASSAAGQVTPVLRDGDLVLTMGAGDVYQVGEQILKGWM